MGSDDSNNSDEDNRDRVLAPDDLDITNRPEVEEIDDGRYVVSPNGPAKKPDRKLLENPDWLSSDEEVDETDRQPSARQSSPQDQSPNADQSTPQQPSSAQSTPQQPSSAQSTPQQPSSAQSTPQQSSESEQSRERTPQSPSDSSQSTARSQPSPESQPSSNTQQASADTQQPPVDSQSTATADSPVQPASELAAHDQPPVDPPAVELTNENVSKFLAKSLAQGSGDYGFDATVNIEGQLNRGRMTSDDIGETLETLLRWYAKQTTDEVAPEAVLGIILAGSDLAVEYPVQSVYAVVKQHDLKPDDTISDLLAAVRAEGSFTVPPSTD